MGDKGLSEKELAAKEWTPEQFAADFPDVLEKLVSERAEKLAVDSVKAKLAALEAEKVKAVADAITSERKRVGEIFAACVTGLEGIAKDHILKGTSIEDAKSAFLEEIRKRTPESVGGSVSAETSLSSLPIEERAKKEFAEKKEIQDEFKTEAAYAAYLRADVAGRVRIFKRTA